MPLPPSADREEVHLRAIEMRGYRRADGDYEIEGRVTDTKTRDIHPHGRAALAPRRTRSRPCSRQTHPRSAPAFERHP